MNAGDRADIVREYIDKVWNRGDLQALEELTAPSFTFQLGGQPPIERAGMSQFLRTTRLAFPDWRVEVLELVAQAELVAVRWRGTVTHGGPFHGIPPTGRRVHVSGMNMYRVSEGRVAEEWEQMDSLGMLRQLGVLPAA
ncbi:MAG: ester cyclase [Phycisphaerae bacterium]|nr:ester cyclase [Phycisphaerae bacterium]